MKIEFHGAAGGVTGSCHLLECAGKRLVVDCGLYQGGREIEDENHEPFWFDPDAIDFLLLTHAHLDHCGRIPLLERRGFQGEIIATAATRELARLVMLDAPHLNEEEAARRNRSAARRGRKGPAMEPLYGTIDALASLDRFGRVARYGQPIELARGLRATFQDAGHILGSASVLVEASEGSKKRRIVFSGDLGSGGRVRHHLKHNLWRADCSVVFVGYAARGALARRIIDGADTVRLFGDEIRVRASIHTIGGFSAHADTDELYHWFQSVPPPSTTFLVHGEDQAMEVFARRLDAHKVPQPELHESFEL